MIKPKKYKQLIKLCNFYNLGKIEFYEILNFIKFKRHKTIFFKGIKSASKKSKYSNKKWGIYYKKLFNAGLLVQKTYNKKETLNLF